MLQKTLKNTSKELDRIETTLYKHSKAVKVSNFRQKSDEQELTSTVVID